MKSRLIYGSGEIGWGRRGGGGGSKKVIMIVL